MLIEEQYRNATEKYMIGESGLFEPFTDDIGKLFRFCRRKYGKCTSKVYVDNPDKTAKAIGWVFEKLVKYEDTGEKYLQEVWITLHESRPTETTEYHYIELQ